MPQSDNQTPRIVDTFSDAFADSSLDDESSTHIMPTRFLGMGLLIAWLCCTHVTSIFPAITLSTPALSALHDASDLGMRIGDISTFIILALMAPKIVALGNHLKPIGAFTVLSGIGTVFIGLFLIPHAASYESVLATGIITAIGGACLFCLWAQIYCRMNSTQTLIYGSASCITAAVVSFIISTMQQPYAIVFTAILPACSLCCVWASLKLVPAQSAINPGIRFPVPWKLIALMTIGGFMSSLAGMMMVEVSMGAVHRVWATGLAGLAILLMMYVRREHCDVRFLANVALPLAIAAYALIPLAGTLDVALAVSFLGKLAYVWFTFFVLIVLVNIAQRYDVPSLRMFAVARACSESAICVGGFARHTAISTNVISNPAFLFGCMGAGIVMLLVCVIIWMSEKSVNADWGASGVSVETGLHVVSPHERYLNRCEELGERFGLTEREVEVLALLGQEKSRADIERELFLSENTVKTHIRHVYQKLDVHSKADVHALLDN